MFKAFDNAVKKSRFLFFFKTIWWLEIQFEVNSLSRLIRKKFEA